MKGEVCGNFYISIDYEHHLNSEKHVASGKQQ